MGFVLGMLYYPHKKGISLLFKNNNNNDKDTPLHIACRYHDRDEVMDVVEDTITRFYSEERPFNIVEAVLTAAIDDEIHVDGEFFLLRRQPDVLVTLLSGLTTTTINNNEGIDSSN